MRSPRRSTGPVRAIDSGSRSDEIDEVDTRPELVPLNYWRHLVAYLALAGSLAYATDDWNLDRWKQAAFVIAMEAASHFVPPRSPVLLTPVLGRRFASASRMQVGW